MIKIVLFVLLVAACVAVVVLAMKNSKSNKKRAAAVKKLKVYKSVTTDLGREAGLMTGVPRPVLDCVFSEDADGIRASEYMVRKICATGGDMPQKLATACASKFNADSFKDRLGNCGGSM